MASLIIHEIGHLIGALIFGIKIKKIILSCFGGLICFDKNDIIDTKNFSILLLLGPLTNIVVGIFFLLLWYYNSHYQSGTFIIKETLENSLALLSGYNLCYGLINLIPLLPFDGGIIINKVITTKSKDNYRIVYKIFLYFNEAFFILTITIIFYGVLSTSQYTLFIIIIYLSLLYNDFKFKLKDFPLLESNNREGLG